MTRWSAVAALALMVVLSAPARAATVSELQQAAAAGDAKAQYDLGVKYEYGQGVDQDYSKAAEWTLKSAEQGYADAQYNYGLMLEYGQGVGRNLAEADKWYERAAEQGMEGAVQARGMLARKRNPPRAAMSSGSRQAASASDSLGDGGDERDAAQGGDARSGDMGSSRLRDRERLRKISNGSARPDR